MQIFVDADACPVVRIVERTEEDDNRFAESFEKMICKVMEIENGI